MSWESTADGDGWASLGAAGGRDRHPVHRLAAFFGSRSPDLVLVVGLTVVVCVAAIHAIVGPHVSLSVFYLLPVALVTWTSGRIMGSLMAGASALSWLVAELLAGVRPDSLAPYWNMGVQFTVLLIVATLVGTLQATLERHREVMRQERDATDRLRALNALKDTLLHAVSHDLRGPIAAILGAAQTLQRSSQLKLRADQQESLIAAIQVSGRKLDRLVSDLLDLDRLDRGLLEPERAPVDVGRLAEAVVAESDQLDEHPVRVEAEPVLVSLDGAKVERIVENLLANAARHTPVGTPVRVAVEVRDAGVLLTVEDEGPGIPDQLKPIIFQPFRRGERASGGAGIGLSLVSRFAQLHGGRAWVEDRPGGGAVFRVMLPGEVMPAEAPDTAAVG